MFYYFVCSHVHVVGSCPAMLDAGRLPVVCLLVATGDIGLSPHIRVRPVMSHFLYRHVYEECCHSILCLLTADAWSPSLICFLCRRSPYSELQHAFTGTLTACYQLRLSLISAVLQPYTSNNQFTSLIRHP